MARVLITGGSGLVGRRVVQAMAGGPDEVRTVGRADGDLLADGAWAALLTAHRPDVVVHLAWSASSLPGYRQDADNWRWADSTVAAAELAAARGIRFIGTGTSVDDVVAEDPYSRSKAGARTALADGIADGALTWIRPFYVFDETGPSPAVLRAALAAQADGAPVGLASPDARHDFVHATDVGTAIRTVVAAELTGAIDIGSGALASVAELVEAYRVAWTPAGSPSDAAASEAVADVARLRAAGWSPDATDARLGR